jgi:hypothetical protein
MRHSPISAEAGVSTAADEMRNAEKRLKTLVGDVAFFAPGAGKVPVSDMKDHHHESS